MPRQSLLVKREWAIEHQYSYLGPSIFSKILDGSIPTTFIHEDEKCVAFNDVAPQVFYLLFIGIFKVDRNLSI